MKKIRSIKIENVKGIDSKQFNLDIIPNKPSIVVAPNGFGKSSLTTAFNSLNANGIKLDKDTFHKNDESNKPKLVLTVENDDKSQEDLTADENINNIKNRFDIFVINNLLVSKYKKQSFGGKTVVSSSIEVGSIILVDKIPAKKSILYAPAAEKADFGANGKVLTNISILLTNPLFLCDMVNYVDLSKYSGARISDAITKFVTGINSLEGSASKIISEAAIELLPELKRKAVLEPIVKILEKYVKGLSSEVDKYLTAVQIVNIYKKDKKVFDQSCKYAEYLNEKKTYEHMLTAFNATWKNIKATEVDGLLVINFPKANQISNGERDVITFLSSLIRATRKLKKDDCILIVDEVFDYLDDANLITAQYYITQMISDFKKSGRKLYPLIMTHLNPYYFKNFCFKDQKIYYLNKQNAHINRSVEKVLFNRENTSIKAELSCYFLHFNTNHVDASANFYLVGLDISLGKSEEFKAVIDAEVVKYVSGKTSYDPISVCLALRIKVEEVVYSLLQSSEDKAEFISIHKTVSKLDFAGEKGIEISETFYLLGVIYNDIAHIKPNTDYSTPIISKLSNKIINNMVIDLFK